MTRSPRIPGYVDAVVTVRRSVSIFLAVWSVSNLFFGCGSFASYRVDLLILGPRESSCAANFPAPVGGWLFTGLVLLVATVLWFGPWSRFSRDRMRVQPLIPAQNRRRLGRAGGWLLMALGLSVVLSSLWSVFFSSVGSGWRGDPPCFLFEIGCYEVPMSGPAILIEVAPYRVPAFSLVRWLGIAFGLSTLLWGSMELRLERRAIRQLIQAVVVVAVLGILIASGYPGIGTFQATVSVIVLAVAVPVFLLRNVVAGWLAEPLRSRYALHVAMGSSVILGAWTYVLASVNPMGCQRGVRCADELRSATLLAVAAAAAGLYVVYSRWKAISPATRARDESQIEWGSIDTAELSSRQLAAFGVIGLALLIGAILLMRLTSRPAYEATAEVAITFFAHEDAPRPDLEVERLVFASPRIANDAVALAADLGSGHFAWYGPELLDAPPPFDTSMILNRLRIEIDTDSQGLLVHFRADNPTVAQVGANLVAEAYAQWRPSIQYRPRLEPGWSATPDPLEPVSVSVSFAPTPTNRVDRPDGAAVMRFLLVSLLAVYLTWRWWPDPRRRSGEDEAASANPALA